MPIIGIDLLRVKPCALSYILRNPRRNTIVDTVIMEIIEFVTSRRLSDTHIYAERIYLTYNAVPGLVSCARIVDYLLIF